MAIGALSGFDNAGVFAGESRAPSRDVPRSVLVAAPLIASLYVLGTGAMLAYFPPGKIDLAAPLPQLMQAGFGNAGFGEVVTLLIVGGAVLGNIAGAAPMVAMTARFPMVIGWDGLLPEWWSELHPKFRTPVKSLAICTMYALLFSVVMLSKRIPNLRPSVSARLAAVSGFAVCVAALPLQILPVTGVTDRGIFAAKVAGLFIVINSTCAWLYWRGTKRLSGVGRVS